MNLLPNPTGIPGGRLWGLISMLNTDGGLAFTPQTCKETMLYYIGQDAIMDYKPFVHLGPQVNGRIDQKNPALVLWVLDGYGATRDETVGRIHDALHMLCEKMGLEKPTVRGIENTKNAIAVFFPSYFMHTSSATMHGLMTIVRGAARWKHPTSSIYKFLDSMMARASAGCPDATHLTHSQNTYDFLNKTMDCNIHGYNDWLLRRGTGYAWHGLVSYNSSSIDTDNPSREVHTIDALITRNGLWTNVVKLVAPGPQYRSWAHSYLERPAD